MVDCMSHLSHWQEFIFPFGNMHNSSVDFHISQKKFINETQSCGQHSFSTGALLTENQN
jgi:hypothetical protein